MVLTSTANRVLSKDGTEIGYLSMGNGPAVIVLPGVLSMAVDYSAFARSLAERFTVHILERRGRGVSGPQGEAYCIERECEDVLAVRRETGASLLVGHSFGGLVALEVARNDQDLAGVAVYEPGVSIDGSMPTAWMPGYERKLAEKKNVDAFVEFTLADAPPPIGKTPPWVMRPLAVLFFSIFRAYRPMLGLLRQNLLEWREIARLDGTYENYREISAPVLFMYGGKSRSRAVDLAAERLPAVIPHLTVKEFPRLDHFGIERTAPREVATAVGDYFLATDRPSPGITMQGGNHGL